MRALIPFTVALFAANGVFAAEPAQLYVPTQPTLMWANAVTIGDRVSIRIQTIQYVSMVQDYVVKVPVTQKTWNKGKLVQQTKMTEQRQQRSYLQPIQGPIVDVPVDGKTTYVFQTNGVQLDAPGVAQILGNLSSVLVSTSGPVSQATLQTTPAVTLIVQVPMNVLYPVAAQAPAVGPGSGVVPASATAPTTIVISEPPLAPTTPKKN